MTIYEKEGDLPNSRYVEIANISTLEAEKLWKTGMYYKGRYYSYNDPFACGWKHKDGKESIRLVEKTKR